MTVLSQVKALVERWYSDADNADMQARSLGFPPTWTAITERACADDLSALLPSIEAQQEYIEKLEKALHPGEADSPGIVRTHEGRWTFNALAIREDVAWVTRANLYEQTTGRQVDER